MKALLLACTANAVFGESGLKCFPRLRARSTKLAVVFGDNATGKSLMLTTMNKHTGSWESTGVETFSVSMRMRTSEGMGAGIMYGSERQSSTGATSLRAILGALRNAKERPHPVWLMFDEPDIGLSDKYAAALGAFLAQEVNGLPEHIRGVSVISHSRSLLRQLLAGMDVPPHEVAMGLDVSLEQYLANVDEEPASIEELLALPDRATETRRQVRELLEASKPGI